jgi:hypothetical protein
MNTQGPEGGRLRAGVGLVHTHTHTHTHTRAPTYIHIHTHTHTHRYATYAHLAGVDPTDHMAAAAGLPPIDSLNMWSYTHARTHAHTRTHTHTHAGLCCRGVMCLLRTEKSSLGTLLLHFCCTVVPHLLHRCYTFGTLC